MEYVEPFKETRKHTYVHNYLFDVVMPKVKPNSWKVLCLIVRKTFGWEDGEGGRKQTDKLSYSQLRDGTGIASDSTLHTALKELLGYSLIKCERGKQRDANTYGLNLNYRSYSTEIVVQKKSRTTKTVEPIATEIVVSSTTETVETKESIKKSSKKNGGGNSSIATDSPSPVPSPTAAVTEKISTEQRPTATDIVTPILKELEAAKRQQAQAYSDNESAILKAFEALNQSIRAGRNPYNPITGTKQLAEKLAARGETEATMKAAWDTCKANGYKPMGAFMKWIQDGYLPPQQEGQETKVFNGTIHVWTDDGGWTDTGRKAV